jgi:phosphonopyruvate decarboxylase
MTRADAIKTVVSSLGRDYIALFTTGMISREAFSAGDRDGNFYMLGSMGLLSSFALGIAVNVPTRKVVIVEGDGSALMSLGNFALIGAQGPRNLFHIVMDNECYESTGGQPTATQYVDLSEIASASQYRTVLKSTNVEDLVDKLPEFFASECPAFLLAKIEPSKGKQPPRVALSPEEIKERLVRTLNHGV